ncbi:chromosome partitioning protein [Rhizobium sp. SG_E_25_P2]|uniref:ParA family protein n=1 Tax=Rhizobium sp. SG_E_25_P2 TaxID=2879942 RepID=UPI002472E829|nr:AAA family ATPase [Rhizobium sp. SG_E_25_P2]MDH6268413.1 chromosome partitioning protein [Rhizobium sp. SG_E_25_P2]
MTKVVSLFNHKGGVSKTTTTFHLGWKLASLGKRVLVVDADPQCNLTGLTLGIEDYDSLFAFYHNKQNTDIFSSLAPVFALDGDTVSSQGEKTPITKTNNPNLFILAGNIRFSEIDTQIATALTSSSTIPILRRFVSAFNELIRRISKENSIDIVLIDMSPSVSATNHCVLMSSDYFIIPVSPDFYCYQAIDSLSNVFPRWVDEIAKFKDGGQDSLPVNNPKMLGYISQNYRVYTVDNGSEPADQKTMSKAYAEWLDRIKYIVSDRLVPILKSKDMIIDEKIFLDAADYDKPYHLAGVQNFSGLIPVSQKLSKPIFELNASDGHWSGARWMRNDQNGKEYGIKVNIEEADKVYERLAKAVIHMIQDFPTVTQ